MSEPIGVRDLLKRDVLVARESASALAPTLQSYLISSPTEVEFDMAGITVISPSFFDELLAILTPYLTLSGHRLRHIYFDHSLVNLGRFGTIAKTHGLSIESRGRDRWRLSRVRRAPRS